jgi:hypothetical protein
MTCVSPPELDDSALLAFTDGNADDRVVAHIERCPHCRERAEYLAHLQNRMTAELYRIECPPSIELGEFYLGLLSGGQAAAIAQHLSTCPHCTREGAQLEQYLAELARAHDSMPLQRIKDRVKTVVAQLIQGAGALDGWETPSPTPAFATVRGEQQAPQLYQAEEVQVVIGLQEDAARPGHKVVLGLVMGMDLGDVEAHVWQSSRLILTTQVDDLGNFVISDLAPGRYELILSGPEIEIHIQDLEIG